MQPGHGSEPLRKWPVRLEAEKHRGKREQAAGPPFKSRQGGCEFRLSLKARPRHASLPCDLIAPPPPPPPDGGFGLETPFPPAHRVLCSKSPSHWGLAAPADRSRRVGFLCAPYPDSSKHGTRPQEPSEQISASPLCEQSPSSGIAGGDSAALRGQRVQATQAQALTRIAIQML
jgi:hypothetical protein